MIINNNNNNNKKKLFIKKSDKKLKTLISTYFNLLRKILKF